MAEEAVAVEASMVEASMLAALGSVVFMLAALA
jgi:hypothetical protein